MVTSIVAFWAGGQCGGWRRPVQNLGPGFDSVGLVLSSHDEIIVETTDSGLTVTVVS